MNTASSKNSFTLIAPDMAVMNAARRLLNNHAVSLKLELLPVMAEKLPHLQIRLSTADNVFRDKLTDILARLNTTDLSPVDNAQQRVNADDRLTGEKRQHAIQLLNGQRVRILSTVIATIESGAMAIAQSTDDLNQINLDLTDSNLRDTLQRQADTLAQRDSDLNLRLSEITEDRRALDAAITALEKFTALDQIQALLPSAEELIALGAKTPDIALIQAGLNRLAKILDKVNSALTYRDLTEQRDRLRARYNELLNESRELQQEIRKLTDNLDEISTLASVQQNKNVWVLESRKLYRSLNAFLQAHDTEALMNPAFSQSLEQLKAYINSFFATRRIV